MSHQKRCIKLKMPVSLLQMQQPTSNTKCTHLLQSWSVFYG